MSAPSLALHSLPQALNNLSKDLGDPALDPALTSPTYRRQLAWDLFYRARRA